MNAPFRTINAVAMTTRLAGCVSSPEVDAARLPEGRRALQVTRCRHGQDSLAAIDERRRPADRHCRRGWDMGQPHAEDLTWLGNAVTGERPAVRLWATVQCKGRPQ